MPTDLDAARKALEKAAVEYESAARAFERVSSGKSETHAWVYANDALRHAAKAFARAARAAEGWEGEK